MVSELSFKLSYLKLPKLRPGSFFIASSCLCLENLASKESIAIGVFLKIFSVFLSILTINRRKDYSKNLFDCLTG